MGIDLSGLVYLFWICVALAVGVGVLIGYLVF